MFAPITPKGQGMAVRTHRSRSASWNRAWITTYSAVTLFSAAGVTGGLAQAKTFARSKKAIRRGDGLFIWYGRKCYRVAASDGRVSSDPSA